MTNFCSDNTTGASPEIMAALAAANSGQTMPYGNDDYTRRVEQRFREVFETDCAAFPVATGTAANAIGLSLMAPSFGAVYCHAEAHINVDECGAPELFAGGAKLVGIEADNGKLDPALLEALSQSSSTFYITLDGDGATETIATHGPLTYFARCLVDRMDGYGYELSSESQASSSYQATFDRVEIVATSSQSGWFEEDAQDEGGTRVLKAGEEVVANSETVYPSGTMVYDNLSETSIVAPDGSYLALEGDAGGMALNIFDHDCLVVGTIYRITGAP